ncbi:MAG: helix-turn-helix domain-containing protein [Candidatus Limnocylindrales bacterium]|jgi:transcriptional regulator with XRE-family HTH domain
MDDLQFGSIVRAVRKRRSLSQVELARLAGVSHATVSLIERGHCEKLSLRTVRRIGSALDVRIELLGRWRGGELDRLLSRRHSMLGESFAQFLLSHPGWVVEPEVSFSVWGERGTIDQLGWHACTGHLLVVELKTALVDINEMLGTLDKKLRLARTIAGERGWRPAMVSVWLIVEDTKTNRRHAAEHRTLLASRLRLDGRHLRSFVGRPTLATSGLAFWTNANPHGRRPGPRVDGGASASHLTQVNASSSVDSTLRQQSRGAGVP